MEYDYGNRVNAGWLIFLDGFKSYIKYGQQVDHFIDWHRNHDGTEENLLHNVLHYFNEMNQMVNEETVIQRTVLQHCAVGCQCLAPFGNIPGEVT